MNFQLSLEKKLIFGQKPKILEKHENAHEIREKWPVYVRAWYVIQKGRIQKENPKSECLTVTQLSLNWSGSH